MVRHALHSLGLNKRLRRFALGLVLFVLLFFAPTPRTLTPEAHHALVLFVITVYFWVTETFSLPVTALLAGVGLVVFGIRTPNQAFMPYASDTIFMILGSLMIAQSLVATGADRLLAMFLLRGFLRTRRTLLLGVVFITASMASILPDHGIAAIMLPLVVSLVNSTDIPENSGTVKALIIGVALGASVAGMTTPSGGARNVITVGYLRDLAGIDVSYGQWFALNWIFPAFLIPLLFAILLFVFRVPATPLQLSNGGLRVRPPTTAQKLSLGILALTIVMFLTLSSRFGLGTIAIFGAALMFVSGVVEWEQIAGQVAWGVLYIYGAALSLGSTLQATGAAAWMAKGVLNALGREPGMIVLVATVVIVTALLTNVVSAGATAAVMVPIVIPFAQLVGVDPLIPAVAVAVTSAFAFVSIIGTPPNIIAYSSGLFEPRDLAKVGVPLVVGAVSITLLIVRFYWPWVSALL